MATSVVQVFVLRDRIIVLELWCHEFISGEFSPDIGDNTLRKESTIYALKRFGTAVIFRFVFVFFQRAFD